MPARLRVFISSTQDDLPNERREVAKCLRTFNFEAVNAEDLLPSGEGSWDTIREEIDSCDLMILILGQRYGWVPDKGPGGGEGLSVTHMEFNHARKKGLTILPFFKKLSVKPPQNQDQKDAELRDKFRKDV